MARRQVWVSTKGDMSEVLALAQEVFPRQTAAQAFKSALLDWYRMQKGEDQIQQLIDSNQQVIALLKRQNGGGCEQAIMQ